MHCTAPQEQGPALAFFRELLPMPGSSVVYGGTFGEDLSQPDQPVGRNTVRDALPVDPPLLGAPTGTQRCSPSASTAPVRDGTSPSLP